MGIMIDYLARISHTFLLRGGQVLAWLRQTARFDPQCINNTYPVKLIALYQETGLASQRLTIARRPKQVSVPEFMKYPG